MILRRWPLFSLLAAVLVAVSAGRVTAAAAGNPEDAQILLRQVSTDMLGEIKAQAEQADEARLRAIVERLLIPHVDFRRVSVVSQFASAAISSSDQRWSETPASIAGATRRVL